MHPIEQIAAVTRERDALLVVDGITAVGVYDIPMDRWGVDVLITGSQKALMLPPGLALIALSERAWAARREASRSRASTSICRASATNQAKNTTA